MRTREPPESALVIMHLAATSLTSLISAPASFDRYDETFLDMPSLQFTICDRASTPGGSAAQNDADSTMWNCDRRGHRSEQKSRMCEHLSMSCAHRERRSRQCMNRLVMPSVVHASK
ncbi:hypothetical protein BV20DRAFT_60509 [Pilatotrama ljubarskyi]|nr:hypothetical protein BV20DRAFT_60509 [Pilatotrama ljubarskyi]